MEKDSVNFHFHSSHHCTFTFTLYITTPEKGHRAGQTAIVVGLPVAHGSMVAHVAHGGRPVPGCRLPRHVRPPHQDEALVELCHCHQPQALAEHCHVHQLTHSSLHHPSDHFGTASEI